LNQHPIEVVFYPPERTVFDVLARRSGAPTLRSAPTKRVSTIRYAQRVRILPSYGQFLRKRIWSKWLRKPFKSKKFRFSQRDGSGKIVKQWSLPGIDLKAKVVSKPCNEGWMSRLKAQHAEPAMSDLLLGKDVVIPESRARSIALFLRGRAAPSRFHRLIDLADVK
jgi:hypothetical protein